MTYISLLWVCLAKSIEVIKARGKQREGEENVKENGEEELGGNNKQ